MRGPRPVYLAAALGAALLVSAVGAHALQGLGGTLGPGSSHYVQVVQADDSGVLAGLATHTEEGPLGIGDETTPATEGWIVAHPEDVEPTSSAKVLDDVPFQDPNGGTWTEHKVQMGDAVAWVVPVGDVRHDPTLDDEYNFALVVDWDEVPQDSDLETSYVSSLELVQAD